MATSDNGGQLTCFGLESAVTSAEDRMFHRIVEVLNSDPDKRRWHTCFNLEVITPNARRPKNIDVVLVGESGVWVAELKSLTVQTIKTRNELLENAVKSANSGARLVGSLVREVVGASKQFWLRGDLVCEHNAELFKVGVEKSQASSSEVRILNLDDFLSLVLSNEAREYTPKQVQMIVEKLLPASRAKIQERPRRFREFRDLELITVRDDGFHRIFRGRDNRTSVGIELHLYDIGGYPTDGRDLSLIAKRECDVLVELQKLPCVPRVLQTFTEDVDNPGELAYMVLEDPSSSRPIGNRQVYKGWSTLDRIRFISKSFEALAGIHSFRSTVTNGEGVLVLHRNLSPSSLRVTCLGDSPLFTRFHLATLRASTSIIGNSGAGIDEEAKLYAAPECLQFGISAASPVSDVYALAKSVVHLLEVDDDSERVALIGAREVLARGTQADPSARPSASELASALRACIESDVVEMASNSGDPVASQFPDPYMWDETSIVSMPGKQHQAWRIIGKVGEGSEFLSFRVRRQLPGGEEVASDALLKVPIRVGEERTHGTAFAVAQSIAIDGIQRVLEVADQFKENSPAVLMEWVPGFTLAEVPEIIVELSQDTGVALPWLIASWLRELVRAARSLHVRGYCLCDISPRNIVVDGVNATWIDLAGIARFPVPRPIISMPYADGWSSAEGWLPSDDLRAIAACFHELLESVVFGGAENEGGVSLQEMRLIERAIKLLDECPTADAELDQYVHEILKLLIQANEEPADEEPANEEPSNEEPSNEYPNNPYLLDLLSAYPGSRFGNAEARGLDGEFSRTTYVETELDAWLFEEVKNGRVNLVLLSGNAGDGKTAFLQNLIAKLLNREPPTSSDRIFKGELGGREFLVNLDGSASFRGKRAVELLNDIFAPFLNGIDQDSPIHLVAVNSGPLQDWIESVANDNETTPWLVEQLERLVIGREQVPSGIVFIDLNTRSLVGGLGETIQETFVVRVLNSMVHPESLGDPWAICESCVAAHRCTAYDSALRLRSDKGYELKKRLTEVLTAVHLSERTHITARELKGALSFLFFGTKTCKEIQSAEYSQQTSLGDRWFEEGHRLCENRQGSLLEEMMRFDPGYAVHPLADRECPPGVSTRSYRRRRFLEQDGHEAAISRYGLANGDEVDGFLSCLKGGEAIRRQVCDNLVGGLSRIQQLPNLAYQDSEKIPFRVETQTVTEMVFWTLRNRAEFSLRVQTPAESLPLDFLPTRIYICHKVPAGSENRLSVSLEMYSMLMSLHRQVHYPKTGINGGLLSNLRLFLGRISERSQQELYSYDPRTGGSVVKVAVEHRGPIAAIVFD